MGFWKASKPHDSDSPIGRHIDVYHTDDRGKRDQPHHTDMKIDYDESKPTTQDIRTDLPQTVDLRNK
ncbi:MAG: hypothetical protein QY311_00615 [Candidatus Paceibacterota bacterium]|nr:MAG: hypothetical protein QY311_00615 [Candidatus Paceibacterota bacterium]